MDNQLPKDDQVEKLKKQIEELTQQISGLKLEIELATLRQTQDAQSAKAVLEALKEQASAEAALGAAQAQLPFAELQGIKAGIAGLTLPVGKEGTLTVSAGTAGTVLLRSKLALLELLERVATELVGLCPKDTALVTEAQLTQSYVARFALKRIDDETKELMKLIGSAPQMDELSRLGIAGPEVVAGAYALGFALDTVNGLLKLLRTNRKVDVFNADTEAAQLIGYFLEAKEPNFVADPGMLRENALTEADILINKLRELGNQVQLATYKLAQMKTSSATAGPAEHGKAPPSTATMATLQTEIDGATSLLDSLHPAKKPDAFWAQGQGQVLDENTKNKGLLLLDTKAQTLQVTETRWYKGEKMLAAAELQVAYRLLNPDRSRSKAGVLLRATAAYEAHIDNLQALSYPPSSDPKKRG